MYENIAKKENKARTAQNTFSDLYMKSHLILTFNLIDLFNLFNVGFTPNHLCPETLYSIGFSFKNAQFTTNGGGVHRSRPPKMKS